MIDFSSILKKGVSITSSGTTGEPKTIFRTPENLIESIKVAVEAQKISKKSKILTVTRMTHAGGLLTQTLPAYKIGAEFTISQFDPYTFFKVFQNYTHTFLPPAFMQTLMKTKNFQTVDLKNKWILGGSDPVNWELIESFVEKGAIVQPNWGMSEIGPIAINTVFDSLEKVKIYKEKSKIGTILGDQYYCDVTIKDSILYVKGPTCYIKDWFKTNDIVTSFENSLFYLGRENNKNTSIKL